MNKQTIKAAGFAINRVLKDEPIQPGNMIQYLEEKRQSLLVAGCDLKHEIAMGLAEMVEPGFYEKLFAELHVEVDMVTSIIETLKEVQYNEEMVAGVQKRLADIREGMKGSAPEYEPIDLGETIQCLEYFQKSTTEDIAIFRKEIETPAEINNNETAQAHFKMLLDQAILESDCLKVVIKMLKEECDCEAYECDNSKAAIDLVSEETWALVEANLAMIRARRAELLKGGV